MMALAHLLVVLTQLNPTTTHVRRLTTAPALIGGNFLSAPIIYLHIEHSPAIAAASTQRHQATTLLLHLTIKIRVRITCWAAWIHLQRISCLLQRSSEPHQTARTRSMAAQLAMRRSTLTPQLRFCTAVSTYRGAALTRLRQTLRPSPTRTTEAASTMFTDALTQLH